MIIINLVNKTLYKRGYKRGLYIYIYINVVYKI